MNDNNWPIEIANFDRALQENNIIKVIKGLSIIFRLHIVVMPKCVFVNKIPVSYNDLLLIAEVTFLNCISGQQIINKQQ